MKEDPKPTIRSAPVRIEEPSPAIQISPFPIHGMALINPFQIIEGFQFMKKISLSQEDNGLFFRYLAEMR